MRRLIRSSFLWQFVVGFALGAAGLLALQPAATATPTAPVHQIR